MSNWTLPLIIRHFDNCIKDVDFNHMPQKDSEEYRKLILQTANDVMFRDGRYTEVTEWTLEMFDEAEVNRLVRDIKVINLLTDAQRTRLAFYMDLKEVCYPLFRAQKVDWSAWPWNLKDGSSSLENPHLYNMLTECEYPRLMAAVLYDLKEQMRKNEEGIYSATAIDEASNLFGYDVGHKWTTAEEPEQDMKSFAASVARVADGLWEIENHARVGRLLGFDHLMQSLYDAIDTFIDATYRHNQILLVRDLAAWIRENWTIGEPDPAQEKVDALAAKMRELMAHYDVTTPDEVHTWNYITLEALGMSLAFDIVDDENWDEDE